METISETENIARFISSEGIISIPYMIQLDGQDANQVKCYYQNSSLKKWIDKTFPNVFFSPVERECILDIYIPSIKEIKEWYPNKKYRICIPSNYAKASGAETYKSYINKDAGTYWLADSGRKDGYSATIVMADGKIYQSAYLSAANVCVRPAIVIKLGG